MQNIIYKDALQDAIKKVLPSVSKDESRENLCGINFEFKKDWLYLVSTDGHRLTKVRIELKNSTGNKALIPINEIKKLDKWLKTLDKIDRPIILKLESDKLRFIYSKEKLDKKSFDFECEVSDKVFPDIKDNDFFNLPFNKAYVFDLKPLTDKVKPMQAFIKADKQRKTYGALFNFKIKKIKEEIYTGGAKAELRDKIKKTLSLLYKTEFEDIKCLVRDIEFESIEKESQDIMLNVSYVLDALKVLKEDKITIKIRDHKYPALISSNNFKAYIMPIKYNKKEDKKDD